MRTLHRAIRSLCTLGVLLRICVAAVGVVGIVMALGGATERDVKCNPKPHRELVGDQPTVKQEIQPTAPVPVHRPNVLYVEGERGQAGYLQHALEHESIDVTVLGPHDLPSTAKELDKYDLVIASDIPAHLINPTQMHAFDDYVGHRGGGLLMAGGVASFGSGGYEATKLEQIMPVRFDSADRDEQPDVAIVLVIDRSGSMQGVKLEAMKESARATAEVLSPSDYFAVVAFDSEAQVVVRPTRAANKQRISDGITSLVAGGGTNIYPGLREAFEILQSLNAKVKHVIVMTDGESPSDGIADLVEQMHASRITVSAVGVQSADRNLLSMIAEGGNGRLYMVDDIGSLPRIYIKEVWGVQKSQPDDDSVHVRIAKQVDAIHGTDVEHAPPLHGYVSTKAKPTSETILVSDLGEPILARWRYGSGTVVTWTSDVKDRWSSDWIRWGGYASFWAQVVRSAMRHDRPTPLTGPPADVAVAKLDTLAAKPPAPCTTTTTHRHTLWIYLLLFAAGLILVEWITHHRRITA